MNYKIKSKIYSLTRKILPHNWWVLFVSAEEHSPLISRRHTLRAAVKEKIKVIGLLDYTKEEIKMEIGSLQQVKRLTACSKEPETVRWIEEYLMPGDVLYDIGANVGAYSLVTWSSSGKRCKVYAFEPGFSTFPALCTNIMLNSADDKIIPLQIGLSDKTGLEKFNYSNVLVGGASQAGGEPIREDGSRFKPKVSLATLVYSLDDLIEKFKLDMPNHLKIDVDGTEMAVINGAQKTLSNPKVKSILVEIDFNTTGDKIIHILEKYGLHLVSKHPRQREKLFNCIFAR